MTLDRSSTPVLMMVWLTAVGTLARAQDCSFESSSMCGWVKYNCQVADMGCVSQLWTRGSGSTPSSSTGPNNPALGTYYMFVEASSQNSGAWSELRSPILHSSPASVSFYYHMYGSAMGELSLWSHDGSSWPRATWTRHWWTIGQQHSSSSSGWTYVRSVNLPSSAAWNQISFLGEVGSSYESDMAIDAVTFTSSIANSCTDTSSGSSLTCDFESNTCGWFQKQRVTGAQCLWARGSSQTPSSNTGPDGAQSGSHYMFLETSSASLASSSNHACLYWRHSATSPQGTDGPLSATSMSFYYHMYGSEMGELSVYTLSSLNTFTKIWSKTGQQHSSRGSGWTKEVLTIPSGTANLAICGQPTGGYRGDMALDSVCVGTVAQCATSSCTGNQGSTSFQSTSGSAPISLTSYTNSNDCYWSLSCSGSLSPRLTFTSLNTESGYDHVYLCACTSVVVVMHLVIWHLCIIITCRVCLHVCLQMMVAAQAAPKSARVEAVPRHRPPRRQLVNICASASRLTQAAKRQGLRPR
jgi:hypothetical protein